MEGVQRLADHPFSEAKVIDVTRVPVPCPMNTAPRRGVSSHLGCCSLDGAFVLSVHTPVRASARGSG